MGPAAYFDRGAWVHDWRGRPAFGFVESGPCRVATRCRNGVADLLRHYDPATAPQGQRMVERTSWCNRRIREDSRPYGTVLALARAVHFIGELAGLGVSGRGRHVGQFVVLGPGRWYHPDRGHGPDGGKFNSGSNSECSGRCFRVFDSDAPEFLSQIYSFLRADTN